MDVTGNASTAPETVLGGANNETSNAENTSVEQDEKSTSTEAQQSDETKTTEEQQSAQDKNNSVPEEYSTDSITMPEGMELDSKLLEQFSPVAKEMKLTQANYETLCKHYAQIESNRNDQVVQFYTNRDAERLAALKQDPEFGGEKFDQNTQLANRVLNSFDPDGELAKYVGQIHEANCEPLSKFLVRVGRVLSEDSFHDRVPEKGSTDKPAHEKMGWKSLKEMGID